MLSEARHIGLTLNEHKCELITSDQNVIARFRSVAPDILVLKPEQTVLLGAPVGGSTSVDHVLASKLKELHRLAERLEQLNVRDAFFLLENCFHIPKLLYTLRSALCYSSTILEQYDTAIKEKLQSVLNVHMTESVWD